MPQKKSTSTSAKKRATKKPATRKKTTKKNGRHHICALETEFETVLRSIGDGVIVVDKDLNILHINPVAETVLGYSEDEVISQPVHEIIHIQTEGKQKSTLPLDEVIKKQKVVEAGSHIFLIQKSGKTIPITYSAAAVHDMKKKVRGAVVTIRDVSREYEINRMKSEFVSIVSHQLRTPLSAIKWYLETLIENRRGEPVSERQKDYLEQAFQSNERMILLINDLLNVSRLEAGKIKNTPEVIDLSPVFASVVREMETFARANNVTMDCRFCTKALPEVKADPAKIRQVIQNLVSNGIKYTRGKETLIIDAEVKPKEIIFSIQDQGIGIAKSEVHRLFEPFFRAENAIATQAEGSGLGLYICKMLLSFNKGKIWVDSTIGEGSTFYFSIPRAVSAKTTKK